MPRRYQLRARAARQAETRKKIVDSAIELHETVGATGATITAIARRAGVSRLTVYRHFPDEISLLRACTGTWFVDHPAPDPSLLFTIDDPVRRLEVALTDLYAYYSDNEAMLASGEDARPTHPALVVVLGPMMEGLRRLAGLLSMGWSVDAGPGSLLAVAIAHAIAFPVWRSLREHQGATNRQAVQLMVAMVASAAELERSAASTSSARREA